MKPKNLLIIFVCVGFAFAVLLFLSHKHSATGSTKGSFYLNASYDDMRRVLLTNDCTAELIEKQHGRVIKQEWEDLSIGWNHLNTDRLLSSFDVDGKGYYKVEVNDPEAGTLVLQFQQTVAVRKNHLESVTSLMYPSGALKKYVTTMMLTREGSRTKVDLTVYLEYSRRLPVTHRGYMENKVQEASDAGWHKVQQGLSLVVEKYKDRLFTIPLKRK